MYVYERAPTNQRFQSSLTTTHPLPHHQTTPHRKYKFVRDWLPILSEADSMRLNKILALVAPLLLLILLSVIPPIFGVLTR